MGPRRDEAVECEQQAWEAWRTPRPLSPAEQCKVELLDRAFELAVSKGPAYPGPATAHRMLAQEFSDVSPDEYADVYFDAYSQALKLLAAAGLLAERYREHELSQLAALQELRQLFPGYSTATYERAFGQGLFETR